MHTRLLVFGAVALLLAVTLGACGDDSTADGTQTEAASTLPITGTTIHGEPFDPAGYDGRDVVLWFWAPW